MRRRALLWQLYPTYVLIVLVALAVVAVYSLRAFREFHIERTAADLASRSRMVERQVLDENLLEDPGRVDALCKALGRETGTRFTFVLPSGHVLGDSDKDPAAMESHADRPEVASALAGRTGTEVRFSDTLHENLLYVAMPLRGADGGIAGAMRAAVPLTELEAHLGQVRRRMAWAGVAVALAAALLSYAMARRISRPLRDMRRVAERYAAGDFSHRLPVPDSAEMATLAEALNRMAAQLDERIQAVLRQRNEKEAVFASMGEGVVTVDAQERLIDLNAAAARLFGVQPEAARGRSVQEVLRNSDIQLLIARTLAARGPSELEFTLRAAGGPERFIQAHATVLQHADGRPGAVVVLNDVTRMKRLETMRQDFVANVSHELKTPITSIKAASETLLDGSIGLPEEPRRFLEMVDRHANRLGSIVEDLLALSRIEYEAEQRRIPMERGSVRDVLDLAVRACSNRAAERGIALVLDCADPIVASVNAPLLEQAVVNLIDNAVKYSDAGARVCVRAGHEGGGIRIEVIDPGCGIEAHHLPRLFERFYRVDMARSRKMGGTGLGLAIVKHIAMAHGGTVDVESEPGKGSVFRIQLPEGGTPV